MLWDQIHGELFGSFAQLFGTADTHVFPYKLGSGSQQQQAQQQGDSGSGDSSPSGGSDGWLLTEENDTDGLADATDIHFLFNLGRPSSEFAAWTSGANGGFQLVDQSHTAVPAPASLPLLLSGLAGLAWMRRRRAA